MASIPNWRHDPSANEHRLDYSHLGAEPWELEGAPTRALLQRLRADNPPLLELAARIFQGIIPGADKVYSVSRKMERRGISVCHSRHLGEDLELETALLRPIVSGAEVSRFTIAETPASVIFPYEAVDGREQLIRPEVLRRLYPKTFEYFARCKSALNARDRGSAAGDTWYRYTRTQNIGLQLSRKIAVPRLVKRLRAALDLDGSTCLDNVDVGGITLHDSRDVAYLRMVALLNSTLLHFVFSKQSVPFRGDYLSANRQFIETLPIAEPGRDGRRDEQLVGLVKWVLELQRQQRISNHPQERERLRREIDATDRRIDRLVYELYGLTDDEVRIVETPRI